MENSKLIFKDVVVIGNGPSGITLSYMLHGNWPYYNGQKVADEYLYTRLLMNQQTSLVEQDLCFLSQGLTGRSHNPIAVLFDALNHPFADIGAEENSALSWKHCDDHVFDHVVIGRGKPGGAWHHLDGTTLTISLGRWMELPNYSFEDWANNIYSQSETPIFRQNRATAASVAQYYCDYIEHEQMTDSFQCDSEVLHVTKLTESLQNIMGRKINSRFQGVDNLWRVTVREMMTNKLTYYVTPNVVLATGTSGIPNHLDIPGEDLPFVLHSYSQFETLLEGKDHPETSDPLMVIGAGLTAADAIMTAYFHNIPTVHVFRRKVDDEKLIFRTLPTNLYPEYYKVYQMMQDGGQSYDGYYSYPAHKVKEIRENRTVIIEDSQGKLLTVKVSNVIVLIGSRPDLSFLPSNWTLGRMPEQNVQCKNNPISVNPFSMESLQYPGIYALGPLVGDNFVRFLQGGALAIISHLYDKSRGI